MDENSRMGKTRDLFKKIGDIRGTLPARMVTIKNRNGKAIRGAEEIKKRGQENTELYKKDFLSNQCKETEENSRMGKTRDLFKKIRDTKGIFNAKIDIIKDLKEIL